MITPQTEAPGLAKELGIPKLYFKREDLHPYGSHKGRSIPLMIDLNVQSGAKGFAISSSGNAALAAVRHIQKRNTGENAANPLTLSVFVGGNIDATKKQILIDEIKDSHIAIEESQRPLQALFQKISGNAAVSLRQSTEPTALAGYKALAEEIVPTPDLSAVFIGTSSGTAAQALAEYFADHHVAVNVVQTTSVSPIAQALQAEKFEPAPSIADAIVDKVAHRKDAVVEAVLKTGGVGLIATNDEIREAQRLLKEKTGIDATPNGALGLAGLLHALKKGASFKGAVVCIITGR